MERFLFIFKLFNVYFLDYQREYFNYIDRNIKKSKQIFNYNGF